MSKLMQTFLFESPVLQNYGFSFSKRILSLMASSSRYSPNRPYSSTPDLDAKNSVLADYLIASLNFSKDKALLVSTSYSRTKSLKKPQEVVRFFKDLGFSDARFQSIAHARPKILFADVEKTLKPKLHFFQELGLCSLISRNPFLLTYSLEKTLRPSISLLERVLESDERCRSTKQVHDDLLRLLSRCGSVSYMNSRLESNITYLKSQGITGSQLSTLLLNRTRIFIMPKEKLERLVSRATGMNFDAGSKMFVHAIAVLSGASLKTLNGRFEVMREFGFSKGEIDAMFVKWPYIFGLSETNLRCKMEFLLKNIKMSRSVLIKKPILLSLSIKERLIPRYRVVVMLKSRKLVSEDLSLIAAMIATDEKFLDKYILQFPDYAEELLLAYKNRAK